jgi:cobalt-zinc-cadmium efflux system outer membrane protein
MRRALQECVRSSILLILLTTQVAAGTCFAQGVDAPAHSDGMVQTPSSTRTQGASAAVTPLTIVEALALAEQASPILKEVSASVNRAQAGVQSAKAYTNPSVEFLAGHQSARPISTPGVPGALLHYSAGQTIEVPTERRARIRASQLDLAGSRYQMAGVHLSVVSDVKRAFYDVLRRKEQLSQANGNLSLVEDLRRRVQKEVEVGEKGKLELTRAEAELARARAAVKSADVQLANSRAILKAVIGSSSNETFDAQGTLGRAVPIQPLDELRHQVLASHPALAQANVQTERAQTVVKLEGARRIPQPTVIGEYERQPDISFFRFGVTVPLPLWDRRKGPIAEAKAEVERSVAVARQRRLEIMAALERAYSQYEISNQQVEGLQAGSLREAEAAVEAARAAYKFGERGILEVLDAQRVLQGVSSDLLDALYARQSALIDLEELGATHQ